MEQDFPYLKIKPDLQNLVGPVDEDTRTFRQRGRKMDFQTWVAHLHDELKGNLIPATWVPEYVGVSRTAAHKRIKAGRLTMFVFELFEYQESLLKKLKEVRLAEFAYCVRSECDAWYEEIAFRKARRGPPELFN